MKPANITIATCQHPVSADIKSNLKAILKLVRSAKSQGADIAHFSECNLTGYAGLDFKEIEYNDKPVINDALEQLKELAETLKIWLIIGAHHFNNNKQKPFDILPSVNEGDSIGFYEATGSNPSRVPAGSCFRPLLRFDPQAIPVCPTVNMFFAAFTSACSLYPQAKHSKTACDFRFSFDV